MTPITSYFRSPARRLASGLLLVLAAGAPAVAAPADRPLALAEAITRALENNDGIRIQRDSLASAQAAVTGAAGAYDPLFQLTTGWRKTSDPVSSAFSGAPDGRLAPTVRVAEAGAGVAQLLPTGGVVSVRATTSRATTDGAFDLLSPVWGTQLGAELRQPLLRGRAVDAARVGLRVAAAERGRAAAELRREVSDTVAGVERAYWTLLAAGKGVEVRQEAVRLAEEQLEQVRVRIENQVAPETEFAQPKAELERRRGELLMAREARSRAENELKLLVLGDADTDLWSVDFVPDQDPEVEIAPPDVAAAMSRALASRPEVAAARSGLDRRHAEAALARDDVRPSLDAVVSYDRFGLAGSQNPAAQELAGLPVMVPPRLEGALGRSLRTLGRGDFEDVRAGLELTLPIGNRAARAAAVAAESAQRQAQADLAQAEKTVRAEVLNAAAALETAGQRIESARAARQAAEVQLSAEQDRFAVGLSTSFLVLTRQNDLSRARLDEISARTDYRTAETELARASGSLLADRGIELTTDN